VRAWGEMVCLLRSRANPEAARRLEEMWERTVEEHGIALLCSYHAEGPAPSEAHAGLMQAVLESHGHVLPQPEPGARGVVLGT